MNPKKEAEVVPHILVVEDSKTQAMKIQLFLVEHGYRVSVANDGKEALSLLAANRPDLVISDVVMPIMDGFTATRAIRSKSGPNQVTPIIALTANLVSGIRADCQQCGMNDILYKPVSMAAMKKMVEKWIQVDQQT